MTSQNTYETTRVLKEDVGRHPSVSLRQVLHHIPPQVLAHHVGKLAFLSLLGTFVYNRALYALRMPRTRYGASHRTSIEGAC